MKKGVTDFYNIKSQRQEMAQDEMDVFKDKYRELQTLINQIVPSEE